MFLPVGDTPNPRSFTPWVNYALIAANVAVYLLVSMPLSQRAPDRRDPALVEYVQTIRDDLPPDVSLRGVVSRISAYDLFVFEHGYKPGAPEITDLFFSLFLHGGLLHLFGNMLFLWIYGDNVEQRLGRVGYLLAYLATGVAATLSFALFTPGSKVPLVGASGAISGALGLYFLLFPRNRIKVFVFLFPIFMNFLLLPARIVLAFYLILDNLLPFVLGAASGVAYGAHIGGFLAGLAIAWVGEQLGWRWPWEDSLGRAARTAAPRSAAGDSAPASLDDLRDALEDGDAAHALGVLGDLDEGSLSRLRPHECVRLAGWLEEAGYPGSANRLLRRCLAGYPRQADLAEVHLRLGLLRLQQGQPTAAYQHLVRVFEHNPSPDVAARAEAALARIDALRRR